MADNVTFAAGNNSTPPTGTVVATDDIAGVSYQRVKVTQGADGTATDVSSAAPLQVTVANTGANATAIKVDNSAVTQPVSAASLPLPSGASTAAKQPALGIAGTASSDVLTVQGIASMTALTVDGSGVTQPVSGTVTANVGTGPWPVTDNAGSLTVDNAGTFAVQAAQSGAWDITNVSGTVSLPTGASTAAKQPALGTAGIPSTDVLSIQGITSMTALTVDGSGVTQPISGTVSATQSGTWNVGTLSTITNVVHVDDNSSTLSVDDGAGTLTVDAPVGTPVYVRLSDGATAISTLPVSLASVPSHAVTNAGTFAVQAAQSGTWTVQPGNTANTTPWLTTDGATSATGAAVPAKAGYSGTIAKTSLPTAATDGYLTGAMADKFGRQVSLIGTIRDLTGTQTTTISASTSETTIVTAGSAGIYNDLVMLIISNTSSSTNTRIDFRDATSGSVLFSLQSNGGQPPVGFALPIPIPQTTAANNWTAQCATSTTDVRIYAVFAKNK